MSTPWWQDWAVHKLNDLIQKDWKILEFGSGRSSIWLGNRCGRLITIEHDPQWIKTVTDAGQKNVEVRHWPGPFHIRDELIEDLGTGFDVIIVDGHEPRPQNCQRVYSLLKEGGYFVLDDSERNNYVRVPKDLDPHWICLNPKRPNGKWTRIWQKSGEIHEIWSRDSHTLTLMPIEVGLSINRTKY